METIVLGSDSTAVSISALLQQVGPAGAEVRDSEGRLVGYLFPPHLAAAETAFKEGWTFGSAQRTSGERPKGKTTQQLLAKLNEIPLPSKPSH
jgi:hypothetical protein